MLGSAGEESVHSVAMLERSIPISRLGVFVAGVPAPSAGADSNDGVNIHPRDRRTDRNFFMKGSTPRAVSVLSHPLIARLSRRVPSSLLARSFFGCIRCGPE